MISANDAIYAIKILRNLLIVFTFTMLCYFIAAHIILRELILYRYAIVFDAGSTATRVHIYRFLDKPLGFWNVDLIDEHFEEVKPGISELNVDEVKEQTEYLLLNALKRFPLANTSPIVYCATAGLRSLADQKHANALLSSVHTVLNKYSGSKKQHHVKILSGEDEGIYSWISLSYLLLLNKLKNHLPITAIDMGGISMQITCAQALNKSDSFQQIPGLSSVSLNMHGLMAARQTLMENNFFNCLVDSKNVNTADRCLSTVRQIIKSQSQLDECPLNNDVYLFSYFYDIAIKANLVKDNNGGVITLNEIFKAIDKWCKRDRDSHILCLDLTYMYHILNSTLELNSGSEIKIVKKIKGIEVAWTLGIALKLL